MSTRVIVVKTSPDAYNICHRELRAARFVEGRDYRVLAHRSHIPQEIRAGYDQLLVADALYCNVRDADQMVRAMKPLNPFMKTAWFSELDCEDRGLYDYQVPPGRSTTYCFHLAEVMRSFFALIKEPL